MLHAQNQYLNTRVQTSSPGELTLMLYNGCILFIKQGITCLEKQDFAGKHTNFSKAQNIIEELQSTLNMEYEISHDLNSLYAFLQSKLFEANVKLDSESAQYCVTMFTELRDTWNEALKNLKSGEKVQKV
ncbi:flagellar export chaperone FliS [Paenibacillus sp. Soil787]|uniref:flagellar export chaperone FliS n=1 Tax=Paenibacillus sp. Soil787 TaxID=1736411 RepID=UPI0006F9A71D|nr:flagellar export chaperone FliS [Paenibacillus sp. Soil787]KRF34000.1 flagellar export chaperone FliS [Paenibacillus sp. Soil787]